MSLPISPRPVSRLVLAAVAVTSLSALAACGHSGSASPSASTSTTQPSESATTDTTSATTSSSASTTPSASASAVKKKTVTDINQVKVTGAFGKAPKVTAPYPFQVTKTMSKVLVKGTGPALTATSVFTFNYDGIDATTGKSFDSSFTRGTPLTGTLSGFIPGFKTALLGKHVGDRVLAVIASKDGYDSSGGQGDIKKGDTLIFVVDIVAASVSKATGTTVTPAAGLPKVTADSSGYPTVDFTGATQPSKVVVQPLINGTGATVKATDTIMVKYRTWVWNGAMITDDYSGSGESGALSTTLDAWKTGLVGKKVGSRVMIIDPKAYPSGNATPSISAGATVVYVIDILFASASGS